MDEIQIPLHAIQMVQHVPFLQHYAQESPNGKTTMNAQGKQLFAAFLIPNSLNSKTSKKVRQQSGNDSAMSMVDLPILNTSVRQMKSQISRKMTRLP